MSNVGSAPDSYLGAPYGAAAWLLTKDHKRIAILYLISITLPIIRECSVPQYSAQNRW